MKEYNVSLNLVTDFSVKEEHLLNFFENKDLLLSHKKIDSGVLWIIEPFLKKDDSVTDQIISISELILPNLLEKHKDIFKRIYIDIAVFYDTYVCSVNFTGECLRYISGIYPETDIEITCYPTDNFEA